MNENTNNRYKYMIMISICLVIFFIGAIHLQRLARTTDSVISADEIIKDVTLESEFGLSAMLNSPGEIKEETKEGIKQLLNQPIGDLILHGSQGDTLNLKNMQGQAYVINLFAPW